MRHLQICPSRKCHLPQMDATTTMMTEHSRLAMAREEHASRSRSEFRWVYRWMLMLRAYLSH
jgi:hypothetical protein